MVLYIRMWCSYFIFLKTRALRKPFSKSSLEFPFRCNILPCLLIQTFTIETVKVLYFI